MTKQITPDIGWLFGKLYICNSEDQLKKIADIGNICKNTKYKTFYHSFLLQKYEVIKDISDYEREPFANFERDISKYAYQQYVRSTLNQNKEKEDQTLFNFINNLAKDQYHN